MCLNVDFVENKILMFHNAVYQDVFTFIRQYSNQYLFFAQKKRQTPWANCISINSICGKLYIKVNNKIWKH